jgi:hypothetical protein
VSPGSSEELELSLADRHQALQELGVVGRGLVGLERREIRSTPSVARARRDAYTDECELGWRERLAVAVQSAERAATERGQVEAATAPKGAALGLQREPGPRLSDARSRRLPSGLASADRTDAIGGEAAGSEAGGLKVSTYKVTRLIRSAINLGAPCKIDGIEFLPVEPFKPEEGLLVSAELDAVGFRGALDLFNRHLLIVADAVTVVTGAVVYPGGGSTLVEKRRSKYVLLIAVRRREAASLRVIPGTWNDHLVELSSETAGLLATDSRMRDAAHFLRQAATTENLTTATHHTLQAAEAMTRKRHKKSQKDLRGLLGSELYGYFFTREPTLGRSRRTALAHGYRIEEEGLQSRAKEMQELLLAEFRKSINAVVDPTFSPVRGFVTFETFTRFFEPISKPLDLPALVGDVEDPTFYTRSDPRLVRSETSRRLWRTW